MCLEFTLLDVRVLILPIFLYRMGMVSYPKTQLDTSYTTLKNSFSYFKTLIFKALQTGVHNKNNLYSQTVTIVRPILDGDYCASSRQDVVHNFSPVVGICTHCFVLKFQSSLWLVHFLICFCLCCILQLHLASFGLLLCSCSK